MVQSTANRQAGMGLKIMKFHAIGHMADDIINFGVVCSCFLEVTPSILEKGIMG
jgi:hypothetical protein